MSEKLWGAEAIGAAINRNSKQTYHLLRKGLIRSAMRVGERWVVDKDDLQREFSAREMLDGQQLNERVGKLIRGAA
jgi:hypothetical protein